MRGPRSTRGWRNLPKRHDLRSICVIGSGPIVIGQACEFDYAGCQALKVLREEGFRTTVVNSNPATIMTDPGFADRTYLEPLDFDGVADVLGRERPEAVLPTLGGQTALNLARELAESGVLDALGVELIGAGVDVIRRAEDRELFRETVRSVGLGVPESRIVTSVEELDSVRVPAVVRPAFTLGGHGGGFVATATELRRQVESGLAESPIGQVLVEESVRGWDEFELEVMRDRRDNVVVVCSIENLDPMGVHTGDSVTVAPQMTLADDEYQELRDAAATVIRAVGVETGGSNIQFARNRDTGELRVIEMNPRVSRSSALASKATGYPIAKVAAKLAVGYTLDEIPNDLTRTTPASFEPTLDYVVVKFPRFAFEKFPGADPTLGTQMKSVGEAMGIGRSFTEAFLKAMRSRELEDSSTPWPNLLEVPEELHPWFREEITRIRGALNRVRSLDDLVADDWLVLKRLGVSDADIAAQCGSSEEEARAKRRSWGVRPAFRRVDSCAGEVAAESNYLYSTWGEADDEPLAGLRGNLPVLPNPLHRSAARTGAPRRGEADDEPLAGPRGNLPVPANPLHRSAARTGAPRRGEADEAAPTPGRSVVILGSGPNRIGQGIEFDYCCVHAARSFRSLGYEAVMVNCNPETVSTDYDTSDRLYFEPLAAEEVLAVCERERPGGVVIQFGGQTPLKLARAIEGAGFPIMGTPFDAIDLAEDRERFAALAGKLGIRCPPWGIAQTADEAVTVAERLGYPVLVRPSYVLGGRRMQICYDADALVRAAEQGGRLLVDRFLENALELDVDALADGRDTYVAAVMEHVEEAGIHSGDSTCVLPAPSLTAATAAEVEDLVCRLGRALGVVGLLNVQLAVVDGTVHVLEVNPRASRTVPFASKAIGVNLVDAACRLAAGARLADLDLPRNKVPRQVSVKAAVLPFARFPGADPVLGPEMRATGEVMASGVDLPTALAKAERAAGRPLPTSGTAFFSVRDADKVAAVPVAAALADLGFRILATRGTARALSTAGVEVDVVRKVTEPGAGDTVVDLVRRGRCDLVVNTPQGSGARADGYLIREAALVARVPCITTIPGAAAAAHAIANARSEIAVSLQERIDGETRAA
jgi:carbamoyl-phosphate synthase large subunit